MMPLWLFTFQATMTGLPQGVSVWKNREEVEIIQKDCPCLEKLKIEMGTMCPAPVLTFPSLLLLIYHTWTAFGWAALAARLQSYLGCSLGETCCQNVLEFTVVCFECSRVVLIEPIDRLPDSWTLPVYLTKSCLFLWRIVLGLNKRV